MKCGGTIRLNPVGVCILLGGCALLYFYSHYYHSGGVGGSSSQEKQKAAGGSWGENGVPSEHQGKIKLRRLLAAAIDAAEKGGREVVGVREATGGQRSKGKTKEGVDDPLTLADLRSHHVITRGLQAAFPGLKIISEESGHEEEEEEAAAATSLAPLAEENAEVSSQVPGEVLVPVEEVTVWVDPLDATKEYTEKLLTYVTTMVCVAVRGKPVMGVVHRPFQKTTHWAWVGQGSNVHPPKSRANTEKDHLVVVVSRSHKGPAQDVVLTAFGSKTEVVSAGGAGYKAMEVAEGKADMYLHVTEIKKWDVCAGNAILNAVGGKMTTMGGEELDYSASADPRNKDGLLATLRDQQGFLSRLKAAKTDPLP